MRYKQTTYRHVMMLLRWGCTVAERTLGLTLLYSLNMEGLSFISLYTVPTTATSTFSGSSRILETAGNSVSIKLCADLNRHDSV